MTGPRGPQEGSLGAKLLNIRVGETVCLEDEWHEKAKATQMERQVGAIVQKSWYLKGRRFKTTRVQVIINRAVVPMLAVLREQ